MTSYSLAIDIGASSGRHIISWIDNGRIIVEEVYRFPNGVIKKDGRLCWNMEELFANVVKGIKKCAEIGKIPTSVSVDTWGVDFVLLDADNKIVGDTVAYRDSRTESVIDEVNKIVSKEELYSRTGIQDLTFNTVYQLMAVKMQEPEVLAAAEHMIMIPDYIAYLLSGVMAEEYTEASTSALLDAKKHDWDFELIEKLGLPQKIFLPITEPGTVIGRFSEQIEKYCGFSADVILPCAHDTGSAVLSVPSVSKNAAYISSGTWSLMGTENTEPMLDEESRVAGLTNEGGYGKTYRYLKNIMGLWMLQNLKKQSGLTFDEIMNLAKRNLDTPYRVNVNDGIFLAPENMADAVRTYCKENLSLPVICAVIYLPLAEEYNRTVQQLENLCDVKFDCIHIIGGGSKDELLNSLTAKICKKKVVAGPTEATAIGNILSQMISKGELSGVKEARECVMRSFSVVEYE